MPFRDNTTHLSDISEAIDHIAQFVGEMDFRGYQNDQKTKSAVERQMQIITEAAIRLGENAELICPGPDWKGFRGMGDILRHAYHRVDDRIIWDTIKDELPAMQDSIRKARKPKSE